MVARNRQQFVPVLFRAPLPQLEGLSHVVQEASEVRMELAAMGSEWLEKMARSPHVICHLPAVSCRDVVS